LVFTNKPIIKPPENSLSQALIGLNNSKFASISMLSRPPHSALPHFPEIKHLYSISKSIMITWITPQLKVSAFAKESLVFISNFS
jgi:hypothetical protein